MNDIALLSAYFEAEASKTKANEAYRAADEALRKAGIALRALFDERYPTPLPNRQYHIRIVVGGDLVHLCCDRHSATGGGYGRDQSWGFVHVSKDRLDGVVSEGEIRAAGR